MHLEGMTGQTLLMLYLHNVKKNIFVIFCFQSSFTIIYNPPVSRCTAVIIKAQFKIKGFQWEKLGALFSQYFHVNVLHTQRLPQIPASNIHVLHSGLSDFNIKH